MHALARTFRRLAAAPLISLLAVLSLAIGIAAPTIIFSLVNALVLKPLPVNDPGALVRIGSTRNRQGFYSFSYPDYTLLRDRNLVLAGLIAHQPIQLSWRRDAQAELAWAEIVSGNYFEVLGTRMAAGRGFVADEDTSSGAHAVVISHALWQQRFGLGADTVGSTIRINAHPFTIVGVTPVGYRGTFAGFAIDMWVPLMTQPLTMPDTADRIDRRDAMFLMLTGRLRPGVGLAEARAQLAPLASELERLDPAGHEGIGIATAAATGVHPFIQGFLPAFLALLFGAAALVLIIACANVSGLLVARGADRRKEIGIQLALGASRGRVVRMLLGESLMLAAGGTVLGLLLTWWASAALGAYHPPAGVPIALAVTMDERVAAFAALMALVTTLVVGVLPAIQGSRVDLTGIIKAQGSATASGRGRLRRILIAVQVGLALVLLSAAALLQRGTSLAARVDPGFDASGVLVLSFEPRLAGMAEAATREFHRRAVDALSALPGVQAASVALFIPLGDRGDRLQVTADPSGRAEPAWITYNVIDPGYLDLLRIPIVRGRAFTDGDNGSAPPSVIVTESMAFRLWPGMEPIGRQVRIVREPRPRTVVGVVRDGHYDSLSDAHRSFMFLPYAQFYRPDMVLHVKTAAQSDRTQSAGTMSSVAEAVRREIARLNADVPGSDVRPMEAATAWALVPGRVAGTILAIAGMLALLLAAGGVYGIVSHAASRQTRELGIRIALGATRGQVLLVAMRAGLAPVVAGSACGLALSALAGRALTGLLYGLSPLDPLSFSIAATTLIAVAGAASYLPARRVTALDPIVALRVE